MRRGKRPPLSARERALGLLARREHSARELAGKLGARGHPRAEVAEAIEQLAAAGHQCDERFAGSLARLRSGAGYGPRRIEAELRTHGLPAAVIAAALEALEMDWTALALRELERRHGQAPPEDAAARARRAAFLLRRGFDPATVHAVNRPEAAAAEPDSG